MIPTDLRFVHKKLLSPVDFPMGDAMFSPALTLSKAFFFLSATSLKMCSSCWYRRAFHPKSQKIWLLVQSAYPVAKEEKATPQGDGKSPDTNQHDDAAHDETENEGRNPWLRLGIGIGDTTPEEKSDEHDSEYDERHIHSLQIETRFVNISWLALTE